VALAQIVVTDPGNTAQNLLTALRTLQSNVNEAQQLSYQLQNLQQLNFNSSTAYSSQYFNFLNKIQSLQGALSNTISAETTFQRMYPMVLAFILSACMPVIQQFQLPADPTFEQAMCLGLATAAIAFLAWQAPSIAAGMLSGGPSLSAGSALGAAAAGGAGMIAGLSAIKAAGSIPGAIASGTNSTIKAAGAIKDGFQSGGMSGAAKAMVGAGKANSARMNDAYQSGSIKPFNANGSSSLGANASKAAMNIKSAVNSAISSEAGAHGGMSVPIKHSEG
jgi:hypothetical protein